MADFTIPIPNIFDPSHSHLFTPDAMKSSVDALVQSMPPDKTFGWSTAIDTRGVETTIVWHAHDEPGHWVPSAAFVAGKTLTEGYKVGASFSLMK